MVVVSPSLPFIWSSAIPPLTPTSNRGAPGPRRSGRGPTGSVQPTVNSTAASSPERPVLVVRLYMIPPPWGAALHSPRGQGSDQSGRTSRAGGTPPERTPLPTSPSSVQPYDSRGAATRCP